MLESFQTIAGIKEIGPNKIQTINAKRLNPSIKNLEQQYAPNKPNKFQAIIIK